MSQYATIWRKSCDLITEIEIEREREKKNALSLSLFKRDIAGTPVGTIQPMKSESESMIQEDGEN